MRFLALLKKETLQLFRDKILIIVLIYAFTVIVYIGGKGISLEVRNFPTVIQDQSKSSKSRELISKFNLPYFKILGFVESEKEIESWFQKGKAYMVIVIPPDFERKLTEGNAKIQIIIDGTISVTAMMAISYVGKITRDYAVEFLPYKSSTQGPFVEERIRIFYNPNNLSSWFMSLLELFNMITMVSLLITSAALIREKEYGTIEQLLVTPVRSWEIFLAKIIPTVVIITLLSFFSLLVMVKGFFKVPIRGSIFLFCVVTALYVFTIASVGIMIATLVQTLSQAMMVILAILVPMLMISGAWNPPEAMHPLIKYLSLLSPMRHYLNFGYGVILKGNGIEYVWKDILGIALIGLSFFILSAFKFKKSIGK